MGYQDEPLPALEPMPTKQENIDYNNILEIADMSGVNAAVDALVSGGMSPQQAGEMLQRAGYQIPDQPESLDYPENVPQGTDTSSLGEPETRRAEPVRRGATGSRMDLSFIQRINDPNLSEEQARAEYEKLPPALRYVYDRTADFSYNNQGSNTPAQLDPRDAAGWLDEFYKMQGEQTKAQSGPEAKAAQEQALQGVQSAFDNADKIVSIMDRLRGYEKGAKGTEGKTPKYFGRVGPIDSAFPESLSGDRKSWFIDFKALQDQLALAERGAIKGQGSISNFEQEMLRNAAMGGLDYGRDDASFAQVFEQTYDIAKRKRDEHKNKLDSLKTGSTSAPAATSRSMPSFTVGQKLTDRFGNVRIYRGTDQSGRPILDPVQ